MTYHRIIPCTFFPICQSHFFFFNTSSKHFRSFVTVTLPRQLKRLSTFRMLLVFSSRLRLLSTFHICIISHNLYVYLQKKKITCIKSHTVISGFFFETLFSLVQYYLLYLDCFYRPLVFYCQDSRMGTARVPAVLINFSIN